MSALGVRTPLGITEPRGACPARDEASTPSERFGKGRLAREWQTIDAMIQLYCQHRHGCSRSLCPACQGLLEYAAIRLERCRFGREKPTCAKCPVHCYQRDRREQIRGVMRFAGPRMLLTHPILSLHHWLDGRAALPETARASSTD